MGSCDLTLHLENGKVDYLGGETVRGEVEVRTDRDIECKGLVVECLWQTHGKGNTDRGTPISAEVFQGVWPAGTVARYPFALELPHGPFTYHGQLLNVGWLVRTRADVPWKLDPKAELDVTLRPSPDAEPQPHAAVARPELLPEGLRQRLGGAAVGESAPPQLTSRTMAFGIGCVVLFFTPFLAVPAVGVWKLIGAIRGAGSFADAVPWLLFGVGVLVFIGVAASKLIRNKLAAKKLGDVVFEVEPTVAKRGDTVRVRAFCQPRQQAELSRAVLKLEAGEKVVRGSGTNKKTYRHAIHTEEVELATGRQLNAGLPFHLDHAFTLPADAAPSFMASDNELRWTVSLHLEVARWPDWQQDQVLVVHP